MSTNFRAEVFEICKKLQKNDESQKVGRLINDMATISKTEGNEVPNINSYNNFSMIAESQNTEFHSYLFLDDNIETIELPKFLKINHLSSQDRTMIERGHKTITTFIDLCLAEIREKSEVVADSLNPYFLHRNVNVAKGVRGLLSEQDLKPAVDAFKKGRAYKAFMSTNIAEVFENNVENFRSVVAIMEKQIEHSLGKNVSPEIKEFSEKLGFNLTEANDIVFAYCVLLVGLRESLKTSSRLLYSAIRGSNLVVLNNNNIISIETIVSTVVSRFYKIFIQEENLNYFSSEIGSILLIDCELSNGNHIHEFGMLVAQTVTLTGEFGPSAKYSIVTVDEELIHIHHLIERIIEVKVAKLKHKI